MAGSIALFTTKWKVGDKIEKSDITQFTSGPFSFGLSQKRGKESNRNNYQSVNDPFGKYDDENKERT